MTDDQKLVDTRYSRGMKRVALAVIMIMSVTMGHIAPVSAEGEAPSSSTVAESPSSSAPVSSSSPETTSAPATTTGSSSNPCFDPGYACGWAVVEPDGSVSNVIVCTVEVCGSGSFAGMRTVLQTRQTEGGNVAGWRDSVYDEATNTFTLPGGGHIEGGDFIENAVFPTTSVAVTVTIPPQEEPQTVEEFFESETDVVLVTDAVSYQVPLIDGAVVDYSVVFDPEGPAPSTVLQVGSLGGDMASQSASTRSHGQIRVSMKAVGAKRGTVTLVLSLGRTPLASISTRYVGLRSYATCSELRRDYVDGVRASRAAVDKVRGRVVGGVSSRHVVSPALYRANVRLDQDRDRVVCERS